MLTNRTNKQETRGIATAASWSLAVDMPGAALCVYCPSSLPSNSSFIGGLKGRQIEPEFQGILDNGQLQM